MSAPSPLQPCPECLQGKHVPNCDGTTWDELTDQPTECPCHRAEHRLLMFRGPITPEDLAKILPNPFARE